MASAFEDDIRKLKKNLIYLSLVAVERMVWLKNGQFHWLMIWDDQQQLLYSCAGNFVRRLAYPESTYWEIMLVFI